jgi:hypothetical protein
MPEIRQQQEETRMWLQPQQRYLSLDNWRWQTKDSQFWVISLLISWTTWCYSRRLRVMHEVLWS